MPQMAPYNWFMLFMLFNLINCVFISINYYMNMPKFNLYLKKKKITKYNFMW